MVQRKREEQVSATDIKDQMTRVIQTPHTHTHNLVLLSLRGLSWTSDILQPQNVLAFAKFVVWTSLCSMFKNKRANLPLVLPLCCDISMSERYRSGA